MDNPIYSEKTARTITKWPLAVLVMIVTALLTTFINKLFDTTDDRNSDCMEQVDRLWARVTQLEAQIDKYTTTIMTKDGQIKLLSDSLATKGGFQ